MKKWSQFYTSPLTLTEYLQNLSTHASLFEEIIKEKPKKILEVGTGSGSMSIFLSHLRNDAVSIDNDEDVLEKARRLAKKLSGNVTFILCDAFRLHYRFGCKEFDVVFSQGLLEHFMDDQIRELLKEQLYVGKKVLFSVPSECYPRHWGTGDERLLSAKEWMRILRNLNCDIEFIRYYGKQLTGLKSLMRNLIRRPALSILKPLHILVKLSNSSSTTQGTRIGL